MTVIISIGSDMNPIPRPKRNITAAIAVKAIHIMSIMPNAFWLKYLIVVLFIDVVLFSFL